VFNFCIPVEVGIDICEYSIEKSDIMESDELVALDFEEIKYFCCLLSCTDFARPGVKAKSELE
jgi:hypothetical protein